jgi:hypothetical protein
MRRLLVIGVLIVCGCSLRRVARNAPMASDADTQTLIGAGVSTPGVVISVGATETASLCGPDDADPQHTCPAQSAPDQR